MANTKTPTEERVVNGRKGGYKSQSAVVLAERLKRLEPTLTESEKYAVRVLLRPYTRKTP